jgi:plasmid maintenance system antidote protein VapI
MKKLQNKQTPSDTLRSDIRATRIPMTKIAPRVGIDYQRFNLIVRGRLDPTYDEAEKIKSVLPVMIEEELQRVKELQSKYIKTG